MEFCCVFCKLDQLACNEFLFHGNDVEERCDFENLLHAAWSNFENTPKNQPNFQGCWGKMKKRSEKIFNEVTRTPAYRRASV